MQYDFEPVSSTSKECEKYQSAFHCAVESVESILHDQPFGVAAVLPVISISPYDCSGEVISMADISKLIQGAFVNSDGVLYSQFACIRRRANGLP